MWEGNPYERWEGGDSTWFSRILYLYFIIFILYLYLWGGILMKDDLVVTPPAFPVLECSTFKYISSFGVRWYMDVDDVSGNSIWLGGCDPHLVLASSNVVLSYMCNFDICNDKYKCQRMKIRVSWVGQSTNVRGNSLWKMTRWMWPHLVLASSNVVRAQCCPVHCPRSCSAPASCFIYLELCVASSALSCIWSSELPFVWALSCPRVCETRWSLPIYLGTQARCPKDNQRRDTEVEEKQRGQIAPSEQSCRSLLLLALLSAVKKNR